MKKILFLATIAFMVSCSNEDANFNDNQQDKISETKLARAGYTVEQMFDYRIIGGPEEGWYNEEKGDCSATDTSGCISLDWDIDRDTGTVVEMISKLKFNISNTRSIFEQNRELAEDLFEPIVVEGVMSNFFKLEHTFNTSTETDYFKIRRTSDNILVGVKKFKL